MGGLVGVQFQPQTKPIQMDQRCLSAFHQKSHAPLRVKTSNRAAFRAQSSCPVAVARINASNFMPFYPQILLQTPIWLIKRSQYASLSKADFTLLPAIQYSQLVEAFQDGMIHTTGKDVAFGEIARKQGGTWVRDYSRALQYKYETGSAVQRLKFFGGFSIEPLH